MFNIERLILKNNEEDTILSGVFQAKKRVFCIFDIVIP